MNFDKIALTLVRTDASWEEVQQSLVFACGHQHETEDAATLEPLLYRLDQRERGAVLGVALYLVESKGRMQSVLVPFLMKHLMNSVRFGWRVRELCALNLKSSKQESYAAYDYLYPLVCRMLTASGDGTCNEINDGLCTLIDKLVQGILECTDQKKMISLSLQGLRAVLNAIKDSINWDNFKRASGVKLAEKLLTLAEMDLDAKVNIPAKLETNINVRDNLSCNKLILEAIASCFFENKDHQYAFDQSWIKGHAVPVEIRQERSETTLKIAKYAFSSVSEMYRVPQALLATRIKVVYLALQECSEMGRESLLDALITFVKDLDFDKYDSDVIVASFSLIAYIAQFSDDSSVSQRAAECLSHFVIVADMPPKIFACLTFQSLSICENSKISQEDVGQKLAHQLNLLQSSSNITAQCHVNILEMTGSLCSLTENALLIQHQVIPEYVRHMKLVDDIPTFKCLLKQLQNAAIVDVACLKEALRSLAHHQNVLYSAIESEVAVPDTKMCLIYRCRNSIAESLVDRNVVLENAALEHLLEEFEVMSVLCKTQSKRCVAKLLLWNLNLINTVLVGHTKLSLTERCKELFYTFWARCSVTHFANEPSSTGIDWPKDWIELLTSIASHSPVLVHLASTVYSQDFKVNAGVLRKQLALLVPGINLSNDVDPSRLTFLLSVYHAHHLSILEAGSGFENLIECCLNMEKSPIEGPLFDIAYMISDEVVRKFSSRYTLKDNLVVHLTTLIKHLCSSSRMVQKLVIAHFELAVEQISYLAVQYSVIEMLLDTFNTFSQAYFDETSFSTFYQYSVVVNHEKINLNVPRGLDYRQWLVGSMTAIVEKFIRKAAHIDSCTAESVLQNYIVIHSQSTSNKNHFGISLAMKLGSTLGNASNENSKYQQSDVNFVVSWQKRLFYEGLAETANEQNNQEKTLFREVLKRDLKSFVYAVMKKRTIDNNKFEDVFYRSEMCIVNDRDVDSELLHLLCWTPLQIFSEASMKVAAQVWSRIISLRPDLELAMLHEFLDVFEWSIRRSRGIFSQKYNIDNQFSKKMTSGPSRISKELQVSHDYFKPHLMFINFMASHYASVRGTCHNHSALYTRFIQSTLQRRGKNSNHPVARLCYFKLWLLARTILNDRPEIEHVRHFGIKKQIYAQLLNILSLPALWNGFDTSFVEQDIEAIKLIHTAVVADLESDKDIANGPTLKDDTFFGVKTLLEVEEVAKIVVEQEYRRLVVWIDPAADSQTPLPNRSFQSKNYYGKGYWKNFAPRVWQVCPKLAIQLSARLASRGYNRTLTHFVSKFAFFCVQFSDAIKQIAHVDSKHSEQMNTRYVSLWSAVPPIVAISFFMPEYKSDPALLQYAIRSLEQHSVDTVFFFVPQIVQSLRIDQLGYAEQFVVRTARSAQLFAHQIIWNMNSNLYKGEHGDESLRPDSLKQVSERVISKIVRNLSGADKDFYEREFTFFEKVTGISGKLKPFIRRSKSEKKQKIDEELRLITVDAGVYLPSNPESIVIDIDYDSGRPLQSHAKAPFMATFKIRKAETINAAVMEKKQSSIESLYLQDDQNEEVPDEDNEEAYAWQSAIFKVGDDCRQDLLSLQLISIFKNLFASVGLNLYLFPYRVVATAPGCGIIEVVPNSVSRDMMGRQNVNDLAKWFIAKFGDESSIPYQKARDAFIRSTAAYSLMLYLLQIKDRHNGNIMIDDQGHLVHIDFGFIFDICPGGVKFEMAPFKLTTEMIKILGNSVNSEHYRLFVDLTVKAFLVARPYARYILLMVSLMLGSGLPCFKPHTMENLRERFRLDLEDKDAAIYMKKIINASHKAVSTVVYDGFQKLTNGIPF